MKIAIIGSGSIGLYYGSKLASIGHDVHFLLRSGYEEARTQGIRVFSSEGNLHIHPVNAHTSTAPIGTCDLVIISTKTTHDSHAHLPPLLGPNTLLLTLQNGLGSDERLAREFGAERVLGGLCFVCLTRRTPAQVNHLGHGTISIGEFSGPAQERTREIAGEFSRSGIETKIVDDLAAERWKKLVWNIPFNGLSVAEGGVTVDRLLANSETATEVRALMEEVVAAANALGHEVGPDLIEFHIRRTLRMGPYQPSTMVDYLAGRELEIDSIWQEPLRRARDAGVGTPHLQKLVKRLNSQGFAPS